MRWWYRFLHHWLAPLLTARGAGIRIRGRIVRRLLAECGKNLKVSSLVNIYSPENVHVGNDVYIGYCTYLGKGTIVLEDEVVIGPFCSIVAGNHTFKDGSVRWGDYETGMIRIGKGSWLGAHVCVLSGVTIGSGCTIAAGAVVTRDVPDGTMVGGIPARNIARHTLSKMSAKA